jgi:predicted RNA-binding protein (virulence factor B family)
MPIHIDIILMLLAMAQKSFSLKFLKPRIYTHPISSMNNIINLEIKPDKIHNSIALLRSGTPIKVTIQKYGYLGASVSVNEYGVTGLILQSEIAYYREYRGSDILVGETIPAFVGRLREDGKVDVTFRPGIVDRIAQMKQKILDELIASPVGYIPIGVC